jgi:hypothetical protein
MTQVSVEAAATAARGCTFRGNLIRDCRTSAFRDTIHTVNTAELRFLNLILFDNTRHLATAKIQISFDQPLRLEKTSGSARIRHARRGLLRSLRNELLAGMLQ